MSYSDIVFLSLVSLGISLIALGFCVAFCVREWRGK